MCGWEVKSVSSGENSEGSDYLLKYKYSQPRALESLTKRKPANHLCTECQCEAVLVGADALRGEGEKAGAPPTACTASSWVTPWAPASG